MRTGVSLLGFGTVIAKLRYTLLGVTAAGEAAVTTNTINTGAGARSALLGVLFAVADVLVLVLGAVRYVSHGRAIERGEFSPHAAPLVILALVLVLLGAAVLLYLTDLWRPG